MKKIMIAIAALALTSCGSTISVQMEDGEIIQIAKPEVTINAGDSIVVKEHFSSGSYGINYTFYGRYVGELPSNPEPCTSFNRDSITTISVCTFYRKAIVTQ